MRLRLILSFLIHSKASLNFKLWKEKQVELSLIIQMRTDAFFPIFFCQARILGKMLHSSFSLEKIQMVKLFQKAKLQQKCVVGISAGLEVLVVTEILATSKFYKKVKLTHVATSWAVPTPTLDDGRSLSSREASLHTQITVHKNCHYKNRKTFKRFALKHPLCVTDL